ncbi:transposase [Agrobacterium tumefaciens]|uniref:transposase n=1 Tax=Agrobacterium tumefaciens TaxID=358 RepID=UPI003BA1EF75
MTAELEPPLAPLPKIRKKTKQTNASSFDVRTALYGLTGTYLTQIHGLGSSLALELTGECGTDLRARPSAKHFTSWLCLAPRNTISGGKVLSSPIRRSSSRGAVAVGYYHDCPGCGTSRLCGTANRHTSKPRPHGGNS